ncbi:MAG: hypothetical protein JWN03_7401 [Nocardia sp.]|uniref:hypothetical protein n=1 Tax=Nocardia sp. TaxID=1821 RepID=UPI00262D94EA|nr:hypothetical protein [Nocardia sp.]MCU1647126.1 hypothetical protein [Nocardia sp.]
MPIHVFASSGEAYDQSQVRDDINDGDLLFVPSERVAGWLEGALPVAATDNDGDFHTIKVTDRHLYGQQFAEVRESFARYMNEDWAWDLNALYDHNLWQPAGL